MLFSGLHLSFHFFTTASSVQLPRSCPGAVILSYIAAFLYASQTPQKPLYSTVRGCETLLFAGIMKSERRKPMNQVEIGKFIAEERKHRKYTQRQLAEILGISDKTISKWECGNGFPEVSLLLPLCEELEINVNELLSGKRLSEVDYKKKAEENMVDFIKEKEENRKKIWLSALTGIIATISFITLSLVVCMYTDVISLPVKTILMAIACVIFITGVYVAMQGERTVGYYKCQRCGEIFIPSFRSYMMAMHIITTRKMKCPRCGEKSWCRKVLSREQEPPAGKG